MTTKIKTGVLADDSVTADKLANSINTDIATGVTANTTANAALPKAGGTLTGALTTRDVTVSDGYIMVDGGTTSNTTLEAVLWARSKVGASIPQINVAGDQWQFGGGGTLDTSPTLILDYGNNSAAFAGSVDAAPNTDSVSVFGRTAIGFVSGLSDFAFLGHYDRQSSSDYGFVQSSAGATYLNAASGQSVNLQIGGSRKVVLDASGKVGIGTTGPASKLHVYSAAATSAPKDTYAVGLFDDTEGRIQVRATNSGSDGAVVGLSTGSHNWGLMATAAGTFSNAFAIGYANTSTDGNVFGVDSMSEKLVITTSGILLVGKTATGIATVGAELKPTGELLATVSGDACAFLNRKTSDGDIIILRKDGTTVGSIGANSNDIYIASTGTYSCGLMFEGSSGASDIRPCSSTGALVDDQIDLGDSSTRFHDLYLSSQALVQGGATSAPSFAFTNDPDTGMSRPTTNAINFCTAGSERMRVLSNGNVNIGITGDQNVKLCIENGSATTPNLMIKATHANAYGAVKFNNSNGEAGSISLNAGSVAYNTSSDYRLKENVAPIQNGLTRLQQLNPVQFDWKNSGETSEGFIAHEVQEIFPDAVSGEKDAETMQGMDYGRITPLLVKAIQEQQTIIEDLKSRLEKAGI